LSKTTIEGLSFSYGGNKILDGLDIAVGDSEVLSLAGPNGCGKTTLIKCICGILRPEGTVFLGENDVESMSRRIGHRLRVFCQFSMLSVILFSIK